MDKLTLSKYDYKDIQKLTPTRQGAVLKAVADHVFDGKSPDFTMYDHRRGMTETYKRIIRTIEAQEKADQDLERRIDDLDFLLTPGAVTATTREAFIEHYIENDEYFPTQEADDAINSMLYEDFLQTPYWKSIAHYIKRRDGNQCTRCGSRSWLLVHHTSYLHHGDELHHLDELTTLCRDCHDIHHNRVEH